MMDGFLHETRGGQRNFGDHSSDAPAHPIRDDQWRVALHQRSVAADTLPAPAGPVDRFGDESQLNIVDRQPSAPAGGRERLLNAVTHTSTALADPSDPTKELVSSQTMMSGRTGAEVLIKVAPQQSDDLGAVISLWRQRQDLCRARQRLDLQCQAICRQFCSGDKTAAGKLWIAVQEGDADPALAMVLMPLRAAMGPLEQATTTLEKALCREVRTMPLWLNWGLGVRGLGELSFAGLLGEASRPLSDYRSPACLWKRFGLAVIGGERQRRVAGAEAAELHGYAPQRRSYAYVLSTNLIRAQRADDPYRVIYDARKAYELGRDIPKAHAHNRALRVMVKALLKDAWRAAGVCTKFGGPSTEGSQSNDL